MVESSAKVKPWREAVKLAALDAMAGTTFPGAVSIQMHFTLPKPASAPKRKTILACKKPDLSKLVRCTEDAMTDAGVWEDDSRIVACISSKLFPGEGVNSLHIPGVRIEVTPL